MPADLGLPQVFLLALAALLAGYMFLGRGFAHLGRPPIYVGEVVLFVGLVAAAAAFARSHPRPPLAPVVLLLLGFMVLGLLRTIPYLGAHGADALRDGVLWGYAIFALIIYVVVDRTVALGALRLYGRVVPVFALWLPIAFNIFVILSANVQTDQLGSNVPIVVFKSGDMAVHVIGSLAFLVLASGAITGLRTLAWRSLITIPLFWAAFIAGTINRGSLVTVAAGVVVIVVLAIVLRRSRNWVPVLVALAIPVVGLGAAAVVSQIGSTASVFEPVSQPLSSPAGSPATSTSKPSAAPLPLVTNPGFESGNLNDGAIAGWATWEGAYNIVGGGGYRGEKYASMQNTGDAWTASITSTSFPIQAGEDIAVSVWAKAIEGRPVIATYVNWYDSANALISNPLLASLTTDGGAAWQESAGVLIAPEGTTRASVQLYETAGHVVAGLDEILVKSGDFILAPEGRPATLDQIIENITSIFSTSSDEYLEGTKTYRLQWWGAIVDYTVFGEYFWSGKGFGVNLADDDGFQVNADGSLRSPHNSHITTLARMGVPGLIIWLTLQAAFGISLLRSVLRNRRAGDTGLATVGAWILAYWVAMMVNTSFDPYLEGPQGGIWFWSMFGLGLVVMRLTPRPAEA